VTIPQTRSFPEVFVLPVTTLRTPKTLRKEKRNEKTFPTMRSILLTGAALLAVGARFVAAQNNSFIDGLINQLTSMNLTSLVGAAISISNTTGGQYLYSVLTSGRPLTFLAPNNYVRSLQELVFLLTIPHPSFPQC
jgi:hypothetical protein